MSRKLTSLARFLEVNKEDIEVASWDANCFTVNSEEYLVLTDKEADKYAKEYILETAWAFNTWFINDHVKARYNTQSDYVEEVISLAQEQCESGNNLILDLVNTREFVKDAIAYDGRGHFLSSYDGKENEQDCYFIYRIN